MCKHSQFLQIKCLVFQHHSIVIYFLRFVFLKFLAKGYIVHEGLNHTFKFTVKYSPVRWKRITNVIALIINLLRKFEDLIVCKNKRVIHIYGFLYRLLHMSCNFSAHVLFTKCFNVREVLILIFVHH